MKDFLNEVGNFLTGCVKAQVLRTPCEDFGHQPLKFSATNSQFTSFQNAST